MVQRVRYERLTCLGLMTLRRPSPTLGSACQVVRNALLTLNIHTMDGDDGEPTLALPWLFRICLQSLSISAPPNSAIAEEYLRRGYTHALRETLFALSILQDLYEDLFTMSSSPISCVQKGEFRWVLQVLRVVSSQQ